jgi:hypothetical protein
VRCLRAKSGAAGLCPRIWSRRWPRRIVELMDGVSRSVGDAEGEPDLLLFVDPLPDEALLFKLHDSGHSDHGAVNERYQL